jgi:hypothetical protein
MLSSDRKYEEWIDLVVGVGAKLIVEDGPSIGPFVELAGIGTIITSSSIPNSLSIGTRR